MPNIFDKIRGFCDIIYVFLMIMYEIILTKKKNTWIFDKNKIYILLVFIINFLYYFLKLIILLFLNRVT
jgi:hypothetical protein